MTADEYLERNPNCKYPDSARAHFDEMRIVVWVSFFGRGRHSIPLPIRGASLYKDLTTAEYDEQMIINSKFNRIYVQEKRKQELKAATEQWSV